MIIVSLQRTFVCGSADILALGESTAAVEVVWGRTTDRTAAASPLGKTIIGWRHLVPLHVSRRRFALPDDALWSVLVVGAASAHHGASSASRGHRAA